MTPGVVGATQTETHGYDYRLARRRIAVAGGVIIGLLLAMMFLILYYLS